jgi:hypothetical protein
MLLLVVSVILFSFLALQPQQINRQSGIDVQQNYQISLLQNELTMLMSSNLNSTLIESGVCKFIDDAQNFPYIPTSFLIPYKLYSNTISTYVAFQNTTTLPLVVFPSDLDCPYTLNYAYFVNFAFFGCTTDLTGNNFTVTSINSLVQQSSEEIILQSEQAKFSFFNNLQTIFSVRNSGCHQNIYSNSDFDYNFVNGFFRTRLFRFQVYLQNTTTGFQITAPAMLFLNSGGIK